MSDTIYTVLDPSMREDIVDFANYVFSQAHEPHDFKTLLPKTYADHQPLTVKHFGATRDGKIRAMVALRDLDMRVADKRLRVGFVGTVSVHPYARGEGHMKKLMAMMLQDGRDQGCDLLMLGGQRQRYNYFGFERAGISVTYEITATNLRHVLGSADVSDIAFSDITEERPDEVEFARELALKQTVVEARPRDQFLDIMRSWRSAFRLIRRKGEKIGYVMGAGREIVLTDDALLPLVIKAMFVADGLTRMELSVAPFETERMKIVSRIAERCAVKSVEMANVLNWANVVGAYLSLKAKYAHLEDGREVFEADGQRFCVEVANGVPAVFSTDEPAGYVLDHMEAQRLFFGLEGLTNPNPIAKNWAPLPLYISDADTF